MILTSPGKGVTTVVAGVNDDRVEDSVNIYAAASCTTNAIVPLLKTMDETYGVEVSRWRCHGLCFACGWQEV